MEITNPLVLIAEDEADIADIIAAYLEREGMRTVRAADGRTALDLHALLKPDLVMLDVMMPKLDGWQVLSELRRRGDTPVIMLTALDQDLDKLQALRLDRSPLDRHFGTATLTLDTAGALGAPPLRLRFLDEQDAQALLEQLGGEMARRRLRW